MGSHRPEARCSGGSATTRQASFSFTTAATAPFRLDLTVWALRRRAVNRTDRWDGSCYRRTIDLSRRAVEISVVQCGPPEQPLLRIRVDGAGSSHAARSTVIGVLERALGLRIDLTPFYAIAAADPHLGALARQFYGMKPPRFPSLFEAMVNAMSCQQISLHAGLSLMNRLVSAYGRAPAAVPGGGNAFPRPQDLACLDMAALRALGFSGQKSRSIIELARAFVNRRIDCEMLEQLDDGAACQSLEQLRGVGRWTAEYVLLRGLGRLGVFPADDVGARNHLEEWLAWQGSLDYGGVKQIVRRWDPYAGLVYLHLLLKGLAETGAIAPSASGPMQAAGLHQESPDVAGRSASRRGVL